MTFRWIHRVFYVQFKTFYIFLVLLDKCQSLSNNFYLMSHRTNLFHLAFHQNQFPSSLSYAQSQALLQVRLRLEVEKEKRPTNNGRKRRKH